MKIKFLALSVIMAGASMFANAQETENYYTKKATDNIFFGFGIGGMSVINGGFNTPTLNLNIQLGKYITPTWGVRAEISGLWQSLDKQDHVWFETNDTKYSNYCKMFGELNLDAMLNVTNWLGGYNPDRAIDFYLFAGPTLNLSSEGAQFTGNTENNFALVENADNMKVRIGATAGLGLAYNLSSKWALNLEGRLGVTPSVFGDASDCRSAEATGRLTLGATYTFGGKKFAKVEDRVIEKVVEKEVIKEVPVEVVKEVIKEIPGAASAAIFFKIGKSVISPEGMVNVKLMAKVIKDNPKAIYKVAGFADKATGTVAGNQTLSEKRAQAVFDALVAEGVNPNQLEKVAMGGTDPMFEKGYLNRVVILEVQK